MVRNREAEFGFWFGDIIFATSVHRMMIGWRLFNGLRICR